ncbi:SPOR domain-containing protein [Deinococcus radiomollis]|uniref:SPOR domain-containing protein n=1 Tax=Deinococcus radiomollis TaxID=468916 RepID=UPI00389264B8
MNVVKRRWPDLLIGLLVLLLLGGFAALLLGKGRTDVAQGGVVQPAAPAQQDTGHTSGAAQTPGTSTPPVSQASATQAPVAQAPVAQAPVAQPPVAQSPVVQPPVVQPPAATGTPDSSGAQAGSTPAGTIPTIPSAPLTAPSTAPQATTPKASAPTDTASQPAATETPSAAASTPQAGGSVPTSAARVPTRNDYRISLGSYADSAAVQAATAGVGRLGYTVYPIAVASGAVAQVGPFATREAAAQALADIRRALPGALLYPPRNAPAGDTGTGGTTGAAASTSPPAAPSAAAGTSPAAASTASGSELAASGPVYLQVGAYNSVKAAQSAVGRVRGLGLEPSVNAPAGKLVTVVVGPYQGRALTDAEAKLQSGGIDSFRVR